MKKTLPNGYRKQYLGPFPRKAVDRNISLIQKIYLENSQETEIKALLSPDNEMVPLSLTGALFTHILLTDLTNMIL